jgi:hypothetical protein
VVGTIPVCGYTHVTGDGVVPHDRGESEEVPARGVCGGLGEYVGGVWCMGV